MIKKSNKNKKFKKKGGGVQSLDEFFKNSDIVNLKKLYGPFYTTYIENVLLENEKNPTYRNEIRK